MPANERTEQPVYAVLGATGGVGAALAKRLAQTGATIVIAGRDADKLNTLPRELNGEATVVDATRFDQVEEWIHAIHERAGRLDGVANCVGSLLLKPAHLTSPEELDDVVRTNLMSAFAIVRAAVRVMREGGSIALVSSAAAEIGLANHEAIAAAKAGIAGLTRSAAATYGARGIRVNAVAPGLTRTPLTARITANERSLRASTDLHALGRIGEPEDVAAALAWLMTPDSGWVTGQVIGVDGGLSRVRSRNGG